MRAYKAVTAALVFSSLLATSLPAAVKPPELVQLVLPLSVGADVVGELLTETPNSISILELKSGKERVFDKVNVTRIKHDLSDADAIAGSDLASVVAWKVNKLSATAPSLARVAKIADSTIYLTLGSKDGLTAGEKMNVFRTVGDIVDPVSKKVIAHERPRIAQLSVTEVQDNYAKAKLIGDLEVKIEIGDEVETMPLKVSVAVVPLVDADGKETDGGVALAEDLTTSLVGKNVQVVERTMIKSVIKELAIQSSDLFEPTNVQRLGKQIGASTVLTGKILPDGNQSKVYVRLISVETGQVLLAASQTVNTKTSAAIAKPGAPAGGGANDMKPGSDGFVTFTGRALPDFLTTKDSISAVKDGMDLRGNKFVHTKDRNLFKGDFILDMICTKSAGDGILLFGVGELADAGGEPPNSIKVRFHSPDLAEGYLGFNAPGKGEEVMARSRTAGTHLLRVEKKGNALTISVWFNYDGKLADAPDCSKTVPDLSTAAPNILKSGCIFFGDGVFSKASLSHTP